MSLQDTPGGERTHIAFFGVRNAGKSSLVNAFTGQTLSVVSDVKGTTTDPVRKTMELLPLGPVVVIDTPGMDDEGALGAKRVETAKRVLGETDVAVLVTDAKSGLTDADRSLIALLEVRGKPFLIAANKADTLAAVPPDTGNSVYVSALTGYGVKTLKERVASLGMREGEERYILRDLVEPYDTVLLVIPVDKAAPKGRLILPQQQTLRELLDLGCIPVCCRETELARTLEKLTLPPKLVVTDSQVFGAVNAVLPPDVPLTSFSILFARYKGTLGMLTAARDDLDRLRDGDTVLIAEGCTHHRQCGDIGTEKLPKWIGAYTGKKLNFTFTSGREFPETFENAALVVHCGGCMLNEAEMKDRFRRARDAGVPFVNYGAVIAAVHGILDRALAPIRNAERRDSK